MATVIDSLMISIGVDPQKAREGFAQVSQAAQKTDSEFNNLASKWKGVITGLVSNVIAPVAGAFAIGKVVNSYMSDVSSVAKLTGAYSEKLEEWRLKRAQLARVTREDIELYKKSREALTSFKIAFGDVSAKMMRSFMPVMQLGVDVLNKFTEWINRNQDNIVRFFQVTAGVITAVFLPAILKTSAAMLASPLTWIIGALGALVVIVDDLVTYMQGGKSALSGFWSYFGTGPEIMEKLNKAFTIFKEVISVIWKPLAAIAAGFAAFKIGAVLVQGFISVLTGLKAALTMISAHPIVAMLVGLISLIMWVSDAFSRAGGDWSKVLDLMKSDLIGFLNLFGGFGDLVAEFFAPLEGAFDAYINMMGNLANAIINTFKLVWAYLTGASDEVKDKIAGALWDSIGGVIDSLKTYVQEVWSLIGGAFEGVANFLGGALAVVPNAIGAVFNGAADLIGGFVDFVLSGFAKLFTFLGNGLSSVGSIIAAPFVALAEGASNAVTSVTNGFKALWSGLVNGVSNAAASVASFVANVANTIGGAIAGAISSIMSAVTAFASGIASSVMAGLSAVKSFALGVYQSLAKAITKLWAGAADLAKGAGRAISDVWQNFKALFDSVCGGISAAWQSVSNALSTAFDKAVGFITSLWADAQTLILGISQNIGAAFNEVCAAISEWFSNSVEKISGLLRSIVDTVSNVFDQVVSTISNAFTAALDAASQFFDAVLEFFKRIPQMIASAFDISGMIEGATNKLKSSLGDAWDGAKSFLGFGGDDPKATEVKDRGYQDLSAPAAPNKLQVMAENYAAAMEQQPIAANTSSIVNNSSNVDNRRNSSAKNNTTNITINTNSDRPAQIARAVQGALPDEGGGSDYGFAADNGNYNY